MDSDNNFVVLDRDTIGVGSHPDMFHGHVRTWDQLEQEMKNVLIDQGLVTRQGKIK